MSYFEEQKVVKCAKCGAMNHLIIVHAGVSQANEWETAGCLSCKAEIAHENCGVIIVGQSAASAREKLKSMQGH